MNKPNDINKTNETKKKEIKNNKYVNEKTIKYINKKPNNINILPKIDE